MAHDQPVRTYRQIFALPEFRVLFAARCATIAAVSISGLALGTVTLNSTGSTVLTALALFGGPLITLIGSATVLGFNDTIGPRRATLLMPLTSTVVCALQAIPALPWPARFALLCLPYLIGSATSGSTMRLLAEVVPPGGFLLGRSNSQSCCRRDSGRRLCARWTAPSLRFGIRERSATQPATKVVRRTRAVNRQLLGSPVTRPLYLAIWVPPGLIVGCEALFLPYAGSTWAGYLFAVTAAGMMLGDVIVGRVVPPHHRDRLIGPLRWLLALPYAGLAGTPNVIITLVLAFLASIGYAASLPLQERLLTQTAPEIRGQVFGLCSSGMMIGQALGALVGGLLATVISPSHSMAILAAGSLMATLILTVPLRRSAPG